MKPQYRFLDKDEFGKECHRHQLQIDGVWKDMTGGSSVVGVLAKELSWWASGMAVKEFSGLEDAKVLTKIKNGRATDEETKTVWNTLKFWIEKNTPLTVERLLELCQNAYKAHAVRLDSSAEAGTKMHAELEDYIKNCMDRGGEPEYYAGEENSKVEDFAEFSIKYIKRFIWSEAHCYDENLFVGGITDVGAEMMDGSLAIIDFKSSKEAYFSHFVQIATYNLLIEKNNLVDGAGKEILKLDKPIEKYIIIPFGAKEFTVHEINNAIEFKEAARACITLYRIKAKFDGK